MNTNIELVVLELRFAKSSWTPVALELLDRMSEIAQSIESTKFRMKCIDTEITRYGQHFTHCMWSNPEATFGPIYCICSDVLYRQDDFLTLLDRIGADECGEELYNAVLRQVKGSEEVAGSTADFGVDVHKDDSDKENTSPGSRYSTK